MRKTFSLALLCIFFSISLSAQQLYFPGSVVTDTSLQDHAMTALARQIISQYKPGNDSKQYLGNLFRWQILAKEYGAAIESIHSLRKLYKTTETKFPELLFVQYELYSNAMLKTINGEEKFENAFAKAFRDLHSQLDDKTALFISTAFLTRNGIADLEDVFQRSLAPALHKDSISIDDAILLCRNYFTFKVFRTIEPIAILLLAEDDSKRYIIKDSILIKTKDGAHISAILVRKKETKSAQPCILQFSIYARPFDLNRIKTPAANGYVSVMAYTRGKRFSPDEAIPYEYDGRDVNEVIEWITKQPWCNGKVGMYGGSYNGFTQWAATKRLHPALKTIVPSASVAPGLDVPMTNNVFMSFTFPWTYYVTNNKFLDDDDYTRTNWDSVNKNWYAAGSPYRSLDSFIGRGHNKIFRRWLDHPSYDKYWQNMIPYKKEFSKINIPILTTTGYYDGGQIGGTYYFREHNKYNKKAVHYLLIGPYGHFGSQAYPDPVYNGYRIDSVANIVILDVIFQWFDYILKDSSKPAILKDKINYEVMDANEWKHAPSLSKMSNDTLKLYLANTQQGMDYSLSEKKSIQNEFISQSVDFSDRSTVNSYYRAYNTIYDSLDRGHGLSFITEAFKNVVEISGAFFGELTTMINKKDMDFSVTVYELRPDGKYFYLTYFMGRASYARDPSRRQLLQPGQIQTIPFWNSYITSKRISKGSRIVIVLNVNKSPDEQINYGSGTDVSDESIKDAKTLLQVKWYTSSWIKIPIWH